MNSKVIKWFIRQTGIRKIADSEDKNTSHLNDFSEPQKKKRSLFKERSETLRKLSLSRLSLRKRHKRRRSPKSDEQVTSDSSPGSNNMSPVLESDIKNTSTTGVNDHIHSCQSKLAFKNSSGKERIIKQSSEESSYPYEATFEKEVLDISSVSLPEEFKFDECVQLLKEVDDFTESSEESSSNSVATIKRVDTLEEDSFMDCIDSLAGDRDERENTLARKIENKTNVDQLASDNSISCGLDSKQEIEQSHIQEVDVSHSFAQTNNKLNVISTDNESDDVLAEIKLSSNICEGEVQPPSTDKSYKNIQSDITKEIEKTASDIIEPENTFIGVCSDKRSVISNEVENPITNNEIYIESKFHENEVVLKNTKQNSVVNGTITDPDHCLKREENDLTNGNSNSQIDKLTHINSTHSSSESLPKSNGQNESIAIFDDDGDISATSPTVETESNISKNQQILENNVKELKKLKLICIKNIKSKTPLHDLPPKPNLCARQPYLKSVRTVDEIPKVRIVITHPSPEKSTTTTHSQVPLQAEANLEHTSSECYPEELNPFGDHTSESENRMNNSHESENLQKMGEKIENPFGSDTEDETEIGSINMTNSRQTDQRENCTGMPHLRKVSNDISRNPFAIYEDLENNRLSQSNPFADGSDDDKQTSENSSIPIHTAREDTPPSLPPKLDYRLRRDSLSSNPVPHPRKSKQRYHGSSNSLNYTTYPPVPYPRSLVPSDSSETLNSSLDSEERSNFARGNTRSSLPITSPIRFSKRKRTAPRPPNQVPPQRSVSSDRAPLRTDNDFKSKESYSTTTFSSSQSNQPPPRPPPPKMHQLRDCKPTIKEKFLRIM